MEGCRKTSYKIIIIFQDLQKLPLSLFFCMSHLAPTADNEVRGVLCKLAEPQTLFGEEAWSRRERLKKILSQVGEQVAAEAVEKVSEVADAEDMHVSPFSEDFKRFRETLWWTSRTRAAERIAK